MEQVVQELTWEAPDHIHQEKGSEWYFILAILTLSAVFTSAYLGNFLFAFLLFLAGSLLAFVSTIDPKMVQYTLSKRGLRVDDRLYPFSEIESFHIETETNIHTTLLIKTQGMFGELLTIPLPEEIVEDVADLVEERLPEELLEEPLSHKILEFFGF